jgi:hypothetical protein
LREAVNDKIGIEPVLAEENVCAKDYSQQKNLLGV